MKKSEMLEVKVGEVIENADVDLERKEIGRIKDIKERLRRRREKLKKQKTRKQASRKQES
jgi:hypothetical protein